jgi:hypothetical protein
MRDGFPRVPDLVRAGGGFVMRIRLGWLAAPAALLAAAAAASAQNVDVRKADGTVMKISSGSEVVGPALVTAGTGARKDTILLRRGAVLRYLSQSSDASGTPVESFFLKSGAADADLGFYTRLATPAFWAFPEKAGARSAFYVETFSATSSFARAARGSSLVRLVAGGESAAAQMEVHLGENQGVMLQRQPDGTLKFTTDPHNEWLAGDVRVLYPLSTGLLVDLYVPKATSGQIGPKAGSAAKTDVENFVTSWKSGKVRIVTALGGSTLEGEIGPGVTATIDNASGRIEIGFVKVEFATLKAALSLTSEFASLATSPISKP